MKKIVLNTTGIVLPILLISVILFTGCPPNGNTNKGATQSTDSTYRVITVTATPAKIKPNATSKITANVIDNEYWSTGTWIPQPVQGVKVTFTMKSDCGTLSATTATTDNNGNASVTFTPAPGVTPPCVATITASDDKEYTHKHPDVTSATCTVTVI